MKTLPMFVLVAISPFLYSCADHAMPLASVSPKTDSITAEAGVSPMSSRAQALRHCCTCLDKMVPVIRVQLNYAANASAEASQLTQAMFETGLAVAMQTDTKGKIVSFYPEYSDYVLLLHALQNPKIREGLNSRSKKALQKAEHIVATVTATHSTEYERALALHDYIALHARYDSSLGNVARANAVTLLLNDSRAVCDGYAHTYGLLLSMAGIENRFIIGRADGVEHIWNAVRINGVWFHVDPTYNDPKPDRKGRVLHAYFGMTDSMIAVNHSWSRGSVPAAHSDAWYYPYRNGRRFGTIDQMLQWARGAARSGEWSDTVYIDELRACRSDDEVYRRVKEVADRADSSALRAIAVDKACRAAIYCTFRH